MPDTLLLLALLACPVGMGAMMWMMNRKQQTPTGGVAEKQAELARLQSEIDQVRGQRPPVGDGTGTPREQRPGPRAAPGRRELQRTRDEFGLEPARPQAVAPRPDANPTAAAGPSAAVSSREAPHA